MDIDEDSGYEQIDLQLPAIMVEHIEDYAVRHGLSWDDACMDVCMLGMVAEEYGTDLFLGVNSYEQLRLILDTYGAVTKFQYHKPAS